MLPLRFLNRQAMGKAAPWISFGGVLLFGFIQLIPYRPEPAQAPAVNRFRWQSPVAEALARSACYDCHSDETRVWWAVKVAPFSWLARSDIDEAKHRFNFSAWNGRLTVARMGQSLGHGMPPWQYTLAHPEARLSEAQKQELLQGFQASLPANTSLPAPSILLRVARTGLQPTAAEIIATRCSRCHSPSYPLAYHTGSPARANALINQMVRHGARVSPSERQALIDRFTR